MRHFLFGALLAVLGAGCATTAAAPKPPMKVLVVTSRAKDHLKMITKKDLLTTGDIPVV